MIILTWVPKISFGLSKPVRVGPKPAALRLDDKNVRTI